MVGRTRPSNPPAWRFDDVRAISIVTGIGRRLDVTCGLCGRPSTSDWHLVLSVARESFGGSPVVLCGSCATENWAALRDRLGEIAELLNTVDAVRG